MTVGDRVSRRQGRRGFVRGFALWFGAVVAASWATIALGLLLCWIGAQGLLWASRIECERRWQTNFPAFTVLDAKFVPWQADRTAVQLDELVEPMGLCLSRRDSAEAGAVKDCTTEFKQIRPALKRYMRAEVVSFDTRIDAPPEEVLRFVDAHARELKEAASLLSASEPPEWVFRPDRLMGAPLPHLLGIMDLQWLFWTEALHLESLGQHEKAMPYVNASWKLTQGLARRKELLSCLVALAMARRQAVMLRKVPITHAQWEAEVHDLDIKKRVMEAFLYESWVWYRLQGLKSLEGQDDMESLSRHWHIPLLSEYLKVQVLQMLDQDRMILVQLKGMRDCPFDPSSYKDRLESPRWNIIGRFGRNNFYSIWSRTLLANIDFELTDRALCARDGVEFVSASSPFARAGWDPQDWHYSTTADGTLEIQFTKPVDLWIKEDHRLPLSVVITPYNGQKE